MVLSNQNFFKGVFPVLVRFLVFSFRFFRSVRSCSFGWFVLAVVAPWVVLALALRRACFVRFPSPSSALGPVAERVLRPFAFPPCAWGCGGLSGCAFRWRVVSASALPFWRRSAWLWVVRPAVVSRVSGEVLFFWVFVAPASGAETRAETETFLNCAPAIADAQKALIKLINEKMSQRQFTTLQPKKTATDSNSRRKKRINQYLTILSRYDILKVQ